METLDSTSSCSSSASNLQSPSSKTPQPPPSVIRLWRPAAQRNLRNQWSKLASYRQQWTSTASKGRSHATDLVNSYLSQRQLQTFCFNLWFFEFYGPFGYWGNAGKDERCSWEMQSQNVWFFAYFCDFHFICLKPKQFGKEVWKYHF